MKDSSDWWRSRLEKQGVSSDMIEDICSWVGREFNKRSFHEEFYVKRLEDLSVDRERKLNRLDRKKSGSAEKKAVEEKYDEDVRRLEDSFWSLMISYVRCLSPDAVLDKGHFRNICVSCGFRHGYEYEGIKEYNEICTNCASVASPFYLATCPLCNSGFTHTFRDIRSGGVDSPEGLFELMPRVISVEEDLEHYPPFSSDDSVRYKKYNSPEFRYFFVCPICLYRWCVVVWLPGEFTGHENLCPVCGSEMTTRRSGGYEIEECTNPDCREGEIETIAEEGADND